MACLDFLCRRFARPGETVPEYPGGEWVLDVLSAVHPPKIEDNSDAFDAVAQQIISES
jgi:hypothetical protein